MRSPLLVIVLLATVVTSQAQVAALSDRFGYTGSVTQYASLADAHAGTNALSTASLSDENRDLSFYITRDLTIVPDYTQIGTKWTGGNPSNTNRGFVQIPANPSSIPHLTAFWDLARTTFNFRATGAPPFTPGSRLWNGTDSGAQNGDFLSYDLSFAASGLQQAIWDPYFGAYVSNSDPTALTGHFRGLFLNTSGDTAANGYYTFDFELNLDSWVYTNRDNQTAPEDPAAEPYNVYFPSYFVSPIAVPEPATYGLIGVGMLLVLALHRRSRTFRG